MRRFAAVSGERHDQKKWLRFNGYAFAAADTLAPSVAAELANVVPSMPRGFLEQSGRYTLVAVLSLTLGRKMFVGADGRSVPRCCVSIRHAWDIQRRCPNHYQ